MSSTLRFQKPTLRSSRTPNKMQCKSRRYRGPLVHLPHDSRNVGKTTLRRVFLLPSLLIGICLLAFSGSAFDLSFVGRGHASEQTVKESIQSARSVAPLVVSPVAAPVVLPSPAPKTQHSDVEMRFDNSGIPHLKNLPDLARFDFGADPLSDGLGNRVYLTLQPELQKAAQELLEKFKVPWGAIVALDPKTGRVLALASHSEKSKNPQDVAVSAGFPAASLFKLVTAAAAVEESGLTADDEIFYRGGDYSLTKYNYIPDSKRDTRKMSLESALGKSVNPVFGRVGLNSLSADILERYAYSFGFNSVIPGDLDFARSEFFLEPSDFQIARTAAGFGNVTISPLHAALIAASLANNGGMMAPHIVSRVTDDRGELRYQAQAQLFRNVVLESTANELMQMMLTTSESGTARRHFRTWRQNAYLKDVQVAAKTGTLSGLNPRGRYHWFIAAAPLSSPDIALAALVIDPGNARISGSGLGRLFLEKYFTQTHFVTGSNTRKSLDS